MALVGSPRPEVTWFKDGFEVYDPKRFEFFQSPGDHFTMVLKDAKMSDEGDIRVRASNRAGVASSQAILRVQGNLPLFLPVLITIWSVYCPKVFYFAVRFIILIQLILKMHINKAKSVSMEQMFIFICNTT